MGHHLNIYNSDVKGKIILKKKNREREEGKRKNFGNQISFSGSVMDKSKISHLILSRSLGLFLAFLINRCLRRSLAFGL
jgi:hypothetical protein